MAPKHLGRYELLAPLASGGMAEVFLARIDGPAGFSRPVAVKRLHARYEQQPELLAALLDEARLSARVRHPNVVDTLDVVSENGALALVLPYVHGESLARLLRAARARGERVPPAVAVAVVAGALHGLHAAHETTDPRGRPLDIVHRDVSPHNVLVGADGTARIADFGIAKAASQLHATREGQIKGKLGYMAPEQARGGPLDRRTDIFAAGVVLWEALTARPLFAGESDAEVLYQLLEAHVVPPSALAPGLPAALDEATARALRRAPAERFPTALAMAHALEAALAPARPADVAAWVRALAGEQLARRQAELDRAEGSPPSVRGGDDGEPAEGATRPTAFATPASAPDAPATSPAAGPTNADARERSNRSTPAAHPASAHPEPKSTRSGRRSPAALAAFALALALAARWLVFSSSDERNQGDAPSPRSAAAFALAPPASSAPGAPPGPAADAGNAPSPSAPAVAGAAGVTAAPSAHAGRPLPPPPNAARPPPAPSGRPPRGGPRAPASSSPPAPSAAGAAPSADGLRDRSIFWGQQ